VDPWPSVSVLCFHSPPERDWNGALPSIFAIALAVVLSKESKIARPTVDRSVLSGVLLRAPRLYSRGNNKMAHSYVPAGDARPLPPCLCTPGKKPEGFAASGPGPGRDDGLPMPSPVRWITWDFYFWLGLYAAVVILSVYLTWRGVLGPKGLAMKTLGPVGFVILIGLTKHFRDWLLKRLVRRN
jgi:hypothetical protein